MVSEHSTCLFAALTSNRQCSGSTGISVDLIAISGGTGDLDALLSETQDMSVALECAADASHAMDRTNTICRTLVPRGSSTRPSDRDGIPINHFRPIGRPDN